MASDNGCLVLEEEKQPREAGLPCGWNVLFLWILGSMKFRVASMPPPLIPPPLKDAFRGNFMTLTSDFQVLYTHDLGFELNILLVTVAYYYFVTGTG